ncbi:MAG: hypothetical protein LR015_03950 [Verrucomicrobia bacterium]|nr:hypothetical protein [Verrucomicrobiota bacterium]
MELPGGMERDLRYTLRAAVTDGANREVIGEQQFFVARQGFYASLTAERSLFQQGDQVRLQVITKDINGTPVSREGVLRITRERWREIYVHNRRGHEIDGEAFRALPERSLIGATRGDYRLLRQGFETEEVLTTDLASDDRGVAAFSFRNVTVGYYSATWVGSDGARAPVRAETAFWVADELTPDFGYRPGGVEIIVDSRSYSPGERIPILLSTDIAGRHVLLTRSGAGIHDAKVVRVDGTARLIYWTLEEADIPNVFLTATLISNEDLYQHQVQLEVPPDNRTLTLDLDADSNGYQPGDEATVVLRVTDTAGNPVQGEFSVAVVDEALYSIQPEIRTPIIDFLHGRLRDNVLNTSFSLHGLPYFRPVDHEDSLKSNHGLRADMAEVARAELSSGAPRLNAVSHFSESEFDELFPAGQRVRVDFAPSALWLPTLRTDETGMATFSFLLPDTLTSWRITALGIDAESRAGESTLYAASRQPLIARIGLPRFLRVADEVDIVGTILNNTDTAIQLNVRLSVSESLALTSEPVRSINIAANGSQTLAWRAKASGEGLATIRLAVANDSLADVVEQTIEIVPFARDETFGVHQRSHGSGLQLEKAFSPGMIPGSLRAEVVVTPTLGVALSRLCHI